ncbi:hypothetical protein [Pseudomonas sp. NFX224]|uniref:hypothetical protein n=1 Tax=Pseudomonas sp. NFX224 TaxID=3402862 RepID=UPI003AFB4ADC
MQDAMLEHGAYLWALLDLGAPLYLCGNKSNLERAIDGAIIEPSEKLPTLPSTEVAVIGDEPRTQHMLQPLVALLTEGLMSGTSLTG